MSCINDTLQPRFMAKANSSLNTDSFEFGTICDYSIYNHFCHHSVILIHAFGETAKWMV